MTTFRDWNQQRFNEDHHMMNYTLADGHMRMREHTEFWRKADEDTREREENRRVLERR